MSKQKLVVRGYETIVYPSDLDLIIHREYETLKCPDRRRRNHDLKYPKSITLVYPSQDLNVDIPDDESYDRVYRDVQKACINIIERMEKVCSYTFHYAYNLHDQDVDAAGVFLENHFHVYIWTDDDIKDPDHEIYMERLRDFCSMYFNLYRVQKCKYNWYDKPDSHTEVDGYELINTYSRVNAIKYVDGALRYLIHVDNSNKARYELSNCVSDIDLSRSRAFKEVIEDGKLGFLIDQIKHGMVRSYIHLVDIAIDNDCLSTLRKNQYVLKDYIFSYCGADPFMKAYGITNETMQEDYDKKMKDYYEKRLQLEKESLT